MKWKQYASILSLVLSAVLLPPTNTAYSKPVTFQREYTYQASEIDSRLSCRTIALDQVKRLLLEELGTYLESETEVRNYQLTRDQITTLTAGIVHVEITDEKWNGEEYWLRANITVDPNEVADSIDKLRKNKQLINELERVRNEAKQALREIAKLKKELETTKKTGLPEKKLEQYNRNVKKLSSTDWSEKAFALLSSGNYLQALNAFRELIKLVLLQFS